MGQFQSHALRWGFEVVGEERGGGGKSKLFEMRIDATKAPQAAELTTFACYI